MSKYAIDTNRPAQLIETGKALRSANMRGAKTISHDNDRLQMYMPKAITSFHSALDELESDIVRLPEQYWGSNMLMQNRSGPKRLLRGI